MSPEAVESSVGMGGHRGPVTLCQVQMDIISAPSFLQVGPDLHSGFSLGFLLSRTEDCLSHDLEVSLPPLLGVPAACSAYYPPSPTLPSPPSHPGLPWRSAVTSSVINLSPSLL